MYQTANEVIREGLRLHKERDQRLESVDRGAFSGYDESNIRELAERMKASGRKRLGKEANAPAR